MTLHTRVGVISFHQGLGITTEAPWAGDVSQICVKPKPTAPLLTASSRFLCRVVGARGTSAAAIVMPFYWRHEHYTD